MSLDKKKFANIIIDISHEALDRTFQYIVPEELKESLYEGAQVQIPFGKGGGIRKGYIVSFDSEPSWPEDRLKAISAYCGNTIGIEDRAMELAGWIKHRYGCTLISAMQTVIPVKKKVKHLTYKTIYRNVDMDTLREHIAKCSPYKNASRLRLLQELETLEYIPLNIVKDKLNISDSVVKTLEKNGIIRCESETVYRRPKVAKGEGKHIILTKKQQEVVEGLNASIDRGALKPALLYGVTGSGKTNVYMEVIAHVLNKGKQAIVLIPEIALTFQNLMRFYERFGDRVSVMHSRLSDGERYDIYKQVENGEVDIIIGPRSALFVPLTKLGIVIIDEEHETSYKSEKMPKYHAREVATHICEKSDALLLLGSATPSLESYYRAMSGEYDLYMLKDRPGMATLPTVHTVDMRKELKEGNKSFFSRKLKELMTERIARGQQIMLFINRRGYAGFVSCRECGFVLKCNHCDVSLSHHKDASGNQKMLCHYCGYETAYINTCPKCGSKYFAGFRAGTEKIEQELLKEYPSIKVLRMDRDTTGSKEDYDRILSAFAAREADVLVGTQMIVKGHDFPNVTLVGVVAADLSLNASDYKAGERTFQLITQCAGRAGRGSEPGDVVVQTYSPDNYSISHATRQDYDSFYEEEIIYRSLADYPPVCHMLALQIMGDREEQVISYAKKLGEYINDNVNDDYGINGPAKASISKVNDIYRYVIYIKHTELSKLIELKDMIERIRDEQTTNKISLQYDFDPSGTF